MPETSLHHPVPSSAASLDAAAGLVLRRTPLLATAMLSAMGGAAIYLAALPALLRLSWPFGLLLAVLGVAQLGFGVGVLISPVRRRVLLAAAVALAVVVLWALTRLAGVLPGPDPWVPVDSVIGFTDYVCAALQGVAVLGLAGAAARGLRPRRSRVRRAVASAAVAPVTVAVLLGVGLGFAAASDGLAGAGFPAGTVQPRNLPAGMRSTVEYCRPDGVPLAMDLYTPPPRARTGRPAPVVMYVHGGAMILGDRKTAGLGAMLANHAGALFEPVRRQLNALGFVVVSIDYRLPPPTPWPAPIEDAKCALRFLRAHASDLGVDADRIGAWGSSAGGLLASLLGVTGPEAGFDLGQYLERSSDVQAVVDMFGPADVNDLADASGFVRFCLRVGVGTSPETRHAMSPIGYVTTEAPPFLILHGDQDGDIRPRHSTEFSRRLRAAGVPTTLISVHGTGHTVNTPGQQPSPEQLAGLVTEFFARALAPQRLP